MVCESNKRESDAQRCESADNTNTTCDVHSTVILSMASFAIKKEAAGVRASIGTMRWAQVRQATGNWKIDKVIAK